MCFNVRDFRSTQSSPSAQAAPRGCLYPSDDRDARIGIKDDGSNTVVVRANRTLMWRYLETHIPVQYCKVAVGVTQEGETVTVSFADGTSAKGDIAVGADGVHSANPPSRRGAQDPPFGLHHRRGHPLWRRHGPAALAWPLRLRPPAAPARRRRPGRLHGHQHHPRGWQQRRLPLDDCLAGRGSRRRRRRARLARDGGARGAAGARGRGGQDDGPASSGVVQSPLVFRSLYIQELPTGRVTLLDDAAHCMVPFRGEGGVNALIDAVRVGKAIGKIANEGADVKQALGDCVKEMLQRGNRAVTRSEEVTTGPQNIGTEGWTYINRKATKLTPQVISI
ncbi:hypothetical protein RB594_008442 [Gaeumannomyces avenae]